MDIYSSYRPETKKKHGRTDVRQTDGQRDNQRDTIIPRHYCVAGYITKTRLYNLTPLNPTFIY